MTESPVLRVHGLNVTVQRPSGSIQVVEDVDLVLRQKEVMGLVGETGAGKTLTMRAFLQLLPPGLQVSGRLEIGDKSIDLGQPGAAGHIRGRDIGLILQDPVGMFDPLIRVGPQLFEGVLRHDLMNNEEARRRAIDLLTSMGFTDPEAVLHLYPHQLSGGMSQRIGIAMALMPNPLVLVADEPTSALDAHLRLEVLGLFKQVAREQGLGVVLVSHDLGLVGRFCDSITVIYAGRVVEQGHTGRLRSHPEHPYTTALLACSPTLDTPPRAPVAVIPGTPPTPGAWPPACVFEPRCPLAFDRCRVERPALRADGGHAAACHLAFDERL